MSGGHWPAPRDAEELIDEWLRQCTRAALSLDERIVLAKLVDALVERVNAAGGDYL